MQKKDLILIVCPILSWWKGDVDGALDVRPLVLLINTCQNSVARFQNTRQTKQEVAPKDSFLGDLKNTQELL